MQDSTSSLYLYTPSKVAPILFGVLFAISTVVHIYQNIKAKTWRVTGTLPWAGIIFVAGFVTREISIYHDRNLGIYIASIVLLLIAPPVYAAADYFILGKTLYYVPYLAPIHPGRVVSTFCGLDIIVGVLTGQGGSRIAQYKLPDQVKIGEALLKASLLLLIGLFCCFVALTIVFHVKCVKENVLSKNLRTIMILLYVSCALILMRNIFRAIDIWESGAGYIERHEVFFYIFDGVFMLANSVMLNIWHPSRYLPQSNKTYLCTDGVTEREGPGWVDKRHWFITILDPFDIGGLIKGRDKTAAFWETDNGHDDVTVLPPVEAQKRIEES